MLSSFPFPICWEVPVNTNFFLARHAPILNGDSVTARCGNTVISAASEDGSEQWRLTLEKRAGNGNFFLSYADLYLTDSIRWEDKLSRIMAVCNTGKLAWQLDLPSMIAPNGYCLDRDDLYLLAIQPGLGGVLHQIDARSGELLGTSLLQWGALELVKLGERFLVCNQFTDKGNPGLYTMNTKAGDLQSVSGESTWRIKGGENLLLTVTRTVLEEPRWLHMLAAASLNEIWSAPVLNEAFAFDGGEVFAIEREEGKDTLLARKAQSGSELWRSQPLTEEILQIEAGGSLIFCGYKAGTLLIHRTDGHLIGDLKEFLSLPTVAGQRLYLVGEETLFCSSLL